ncbi:MAG: type II toxin-antitoxin system YafQ family toxin [Lachnospiraceae bacterium]|nr:type II toxin-antitoxin system YafQ family toxin [Lachnospiraceae bacterium]
MDDGVKCVRYSLQLNLKRIIYKRLKKQTFYNDVFEQEFTEIISKLANDTPLEEKYRDHRLQGQKGNVRELN